MHNIIPHMTVVYLNEEKFSKEVLKVAILWHKTLLRFSMTDLPGNILVGLNIVLLKVLKNYFHFNTAQNDGKSDSMM